MPARRSPIVARLIWLGLSLGVGVGTFLVLHWGREFPWQFALASASGVFGLVFVGLLTSQRLRGQLRSLREPWF